MQQEEIITQLHNYFAQNVLDGRDIGLDVTTPLLEWGVINSLEIMRLLAFIRTQFAVEIPFYALTAECFTNLLSIAKLIMEQGERLETASQAHSFHDHEVLS